MDKRTSTVFKGIAIIMMFANHILTHPEWVIGSVPVGQDFIDDYRIPLKLCVAIYAFITGYAYYFSKEKSIGKSMNKIMSFLGIFWSVFIPLGVLGLAIGCYTLEFPRLFLEFFCLRRPFMIFCWYVYFFIIAMLLLPLIVWITKNNLVAIAFVGIVGVNVLCALLMNVSDNYIYTRVVEDLQFNFSTIIGGYVIAGTGVLTKTREYILNLLKDKSVAKRLSIKFLILVGCIIVMGSSLYFRGIKGAIIVNLMKGMNIPIIKSVKCIFGLDFVYVAFFILAGNIAVAMFNRSIIVRVLEYLGRYSTLMWFYHCIFFNVCKEYTQQFLYISENPVIVLGWGIAVCLLLSIGHKAVLDKISEFNIKMTMRHNEVCQHRHA